MDKGVTLIAGHTEVVGDVRFEDQLYVSGKVVGNLLSDNDKATLIVGEDGTVVGEIRVSNVVVNGLVEGDIYSDQKIELAPQAKVRGNIFYKVIEMQLGAVVDGQLMHAIVEEGSQDITQSSAEGGAAGSAEDAENIRPIADQAAGG
ncbi:MAG: polymer-forming cytoskeletal protein [Pseudomonadota bacterium]